MNAIGIGNANAIGIGVGTSGAGGGPVIPPDAVLEPDGVTPLREPNGDFVLEP